MHSEKWTRVLYQALPLTTCMGLAISCFLEPRGTSGLNQQIVSESLASGVGKPKDNKAVSLPSSDFWPGRDGRFMVHLNTVQWDLGLAWEEGFFHLNLKRGASGVGVKLGGPLPHETESHSQVGYHIVFRVRDQILV